MSLLQDLRELQRRQHEEHQRQQKIEEERARERQREELRKKKEMVIYYMLNNTVCVYPCTFSHTLCSGFHYETYISVSAHIAPLL